MNESQLSVRLIGVLPASTDLNRLLSEVPDLERRRGMPSRRRRGRPQELDVWSVTLIKRDNWTGVMPDQAALSQAIDRLHQMAPHLASLDRTGFKAELYVSTIQDRDQGRVELPAEVIIVAGQARLDLVVSILDIGDSDDGDGDSDGGDTSNEDNPRNRTSNPVAAVP